MTTREIERRHLDRVVEWRSADEGMGVLTGYAAVFNTRSQNLGNFVETVDKRAFNKSLGDNLRVVARTNHDDNLILGTTDSGTLRLSVDDVGLRYEVDLPDTTAGRDTRALAEAGILRHSSFAFRTISDEWSETEDGYPLRSLLGVQLVDVAPVVSPAYLDSTTGMRSLADRLGLDPAAVQSKDAAEIRSLLAGETPPAPKTDDGQADKPPAVSIMQRRLALKAKAA